MAKINLKIKKIIKLIRIQKQKQKGYIRRSGGIELVIRY